MPGFETSILKTLQSKGLSDHAGALLVAHIEKKLLPKSMHKWAGCREKAPHMRISFPSIEEFSFGAAFEHVNLKVKVVGWSWQSRMNTIKHLSKILRKKTHGSLIIYFVF